MKVRSQLKFLLSEWRYRLRSWLPTATLRRPFQLSASNAIALASINTHCGSLYERLLNAGYTNLMELTYPDLAFKAAYKINFLETSHFRQAVAWERLLKRGPLTEAQLADYYNMFSGLPYCGFQKLHNLSWLDSRMEQFRYIDERGFSPGSLSYLEFGGASGLLPMIAAHMGFRTSTNLEINHAASAVGAGISERIALDLITIDHVTGQTYDVVSCHQVIEHFLDPGSLLEVLKKLLADKGLLFLSHGYHLPHHPGHIPTLAPSTFSDFLIAHGFSIIDELPRGTFVLRQSDHTSQLVSS